VGVDHGRSQGRVRWPSGLVGALLAILCSLAGLIVILTGVGLLAGKRPGAGWNEGSRTASFLETAEGQAEYDGLGLMRIKTSGSSPALLVIRPVLRYAADGSAAREEIISKRRALRQAVQNIAGALPASELGSAFEGRLKARLKDAFNEILAVAQVTELLFLDYQLLD